MKAEIARYPQLRKDGYFGFFEEQNYTPQNTVNLKEKNTVLQISLPSVDSQFKLFQERQKSKIGSTEIQSTTSASGGGAVGRGPY